MTQGLIALLLVISWIIFGTTKLKWPAFFVLLISSVMLALLTGIPLGDLGGLLGEGFGKTSASIGLLILFGSIIGVVLEHTRATERIAQSLMVYLQRLPLPYVLGSIGFIVSIPVFCDSAFVILSSLNKELSRRSKVPLLALTIALSTGLFAAHTLVPPTPGPLAAAANLGLENLGLLLVVGAPIAFVLVLVGATYAQWVSKRVDLSLTLEADEEIAVTEEAAPFPSLAKSLAPILLPIVLLALSAFSSAITIDPTLALGAGMLISFSLLHTPGAISFSESISKGIQIAAPILIITAMGGTLGLIISKLALQEHMSAWFEGNQWGLVIVFLIAAFLKTAQGSSTVAIITASAMVFPLLSAMGLDSEMGKVWVIIAVGTGAMTVSHANDSYFWIVSQFGNLSVAQAYKYHTFATLLQGVTGLILVVVGYALTS
ncbi:MAG: GntP family permease [Flavobacteriaceae bacterium]